MMRRVLVLAFLVVSLTVVTVSTLVAAEKYKGFERAGRVPWASFQSWKEYRVNVDDRPTGFKTAAEIQKVIENFNMNPDKDQIFYCQSGVRTTTAIFMLYLMGWDPDRLKNYDIS